MIDEVLSLDAIGQAERIAAGDISAGELLEVTIARCEELNPALNAVTVKFYDMAHDAVKAGRVPAGPFHGVPFLLKDFYAHKAGTPTTASSSLLADVVVDHDSLLTARFEAAGFVIFGKTNVPELVSFGTTEPLLYGPTRNPAASERTPSGSSGGSAGSRRSMWSPGASVTVPRSSMRRKATPRATIMSPRPFPEATWRV